MNVPEKIQTEVNLRQYLSYLIDVLGWGFHPDDPIEDYVNEDGTHIFDELQVVVLEKLMEESFYICEQKGLDIYETSMVICTEMYGNIFEELNKSYSEKNGKKTN